MFRIKVLKCWPGPQPDEKYLSGQGDSTDTELALIKDGGDMFGVLELQSVELRERGIILFGISLRELKELPHHQAQRQEKPGEKMGLDGLGLSRDEFGDLVIVYFEDLYSTNG
jgi:hypothetical protein